MPYFPTSETLVDDLFAATYQAEKRFDNPWGDANGHRRLATEVRSALISANRYFLDDEVVRSATELGVLHPDILQSMLMRARLPFPKMWIEWDHRVVLEEQGIAVAEDAAAIVGAIVEQISAPDAVPVFRISEIGMDHTDSVRRVVVHPTSIIYSLDQPILDLMPSLYQE